MEGFRPRVFVTPDHLRGGVIKVTRLITTDIFVSQININFFCVLCPHLHTLRNTSKGVTHPNTISKQTNLTFEFPRMN